MDSRDSINGRGKELTALNTTVITAKAARVGKVGISKNKIPRAASINAKIWTRGKRFRRGSSPNT